MRHRKYEIAQVSRPKGTERSGICLLTAPGAELQPARAYRPPADIRPGEPVYALVNRTSDDFLLGAGRRDGRTAVPPSAPTCRSRRGPGAPSCSTPGAT